MTNQQNRAWTCLLLIGIVATTAQASAPRFWTTSPYRVRVLVSVAGPTLEGEEYTVALRRELIERLATGASPLWSSEVELADQSTTSHVQDLLFDRNGAPTRPQPDSIPPSNLNRLEKVFLVAIQERPTGYHIGAIEFDTTTKRWGSIEHVIASNLQAIAPKAITVVAEAFAPLASFEIDIEDNTRVRIVYRGAQLGASGLPIASPDDVLVPYLQSVDRAGAVLGEGAQRAPWTYLVALSQDDEESTNDAIPTYARIHSHKKTPFGSRRRGRVEQLAITTKARLDRTTALRLYDQSDKTKPLAGYELFVTTFDDNKPHKLGRTDLTGILSIEPKEQLQFVHVKCGSTVVASIPVITGVDPLIEIPLLNESQRLKAEAKASALREELVDLVAARRILAGRIRSALEDGDIEKAESLLEEFENFPSATVFTRRINSAEDLYRADHPIVQRRLDRVFSETRSVIAGALSVKEGNELTKAIMAAREEKSP